MDALETIIVFYYSEQFIANVIPCFLRAIQFSFSLLFCCLIWKGKQHTFGQVNSPFSRVRNACSGLSILNRSYAKIN